MSTDVHDRISCQIANEFEKLLFHRNSEHRVLGGVCGPAGMGVQSILATQN